MQPLEIKALDLEVSALKFLDGVIADYGVYLYLALVWLSLIVIAWIFSGSLRRKIRHQPNFRAGTERQKTTKSDNEFVATRRFLSLQFVAIRRLLSPIQRGLTFTCSLPQFFAAGLCCPAMSETAQQKRGGKPFHSILEPHFDFIREQRQRRKTWREIADLLFTEKGIRVTFHAPYLFCRRKLKRAAKANWEDVENNSKAQPAHPTVAVSRPQPRPAPLPPKPIFKQPNLSTRDTDNFT